MWERNFDQLPPVHIQTGDRTHNLGTCSNQEWNLQPFGYGTMLQQTELHQRGQNCKMFKVYNMVLWYTYTLWKDFLYWVNTPITSDICFFGGVRNFKFYFLSKFKLYNTVLSTLVTMLLGLWKLFIL